jgi:hypothetical protein
MTMKGSGIFFILIMLWLASCQDKIESMKSLYGFINDPDNGLIKTKTIEGIKLTVKYLPAEFLALRETRELETKNKGTYDSLLNVYKKSHTFMLSIASQEDTVSNDPMYEGLRDYNEYRERAISMNFNMSDYVSIRTTTQEFAPVLSSMENTYSLRGQRNIYLVFTDESGSGELMRDNQIDFVFNDDIFQTGINHFVFQQENLQRLPAINFDLINHDNKK